MIYLVVVRVVGTHLDGCATLGCEERVSLVVLISLIIGIKVS